MEKIPIGIDDLEDSFWLWFEKSYTTHFEIFLIPLPHIFFNSTISTPPETKTPDVALESETTIYSPRTAATDTV